METNQNPAQEQPAQLIAPEVIQLEQQTAKPLYNPDEAARVVQILAHAYDPEYILLFGKLAGGTPHSEVMAYDLLIVTQDTPYYGLQSAKRFLKMEFPPRHREIPYANIYIGTQNIVESRIAPFTWFARSEGVLLYRADHCKFKRPKTPLNFHGLYCDAKKHFGLFHELGEEFLDQAGTVFIENRLRQVAFSVGQAVELFYRTLYFVFHGLETDNKDLMVMHDRMRTLSAELMVLLDGDHVQGDRTLADLKIFLAKARYDANFSIDPRVLESYLDRVAKIGKVIEKICRERIDLYKSRIEL